MLVSVNKKRVYCLEVSHFRVPFQRSIGSLPGTAHLARPQPAQFLPMGWPGRGGRPLYRSVADCQADPSPGATQTRFFWGRAEKTSGPGSSCQSS